MAMPTPVKPNKDDRENRFTSPPLIAGIASLVSLVVMQQWGIAFPADEVVKVVLFGISLFGVINNPTSKTKL